MKKFQKVIFENILVTFLSIFLTMFAEIDCEYCLTVDEFLPCCLRSFFLEEADLNLQGENFTVHKFRKALVYGKKNQNMLYFKIICFYFLP